MVALIEIGLANAAAATLLALAVFCITRIWRNPYLAHALWLLVLLKLATPPLVGVPIPWITPTVIAERATATTTTASAEDGRSANSPSIRSSATASSPSSASVLAENNAGQAGIGTRSGDESLLQPAESESMVAQGQSDHRAEPAAAVLGTMKSWTFRTSAVWLAGSLGWSILVLSRVLRFHRLLRGADHASERLQEMVRQVADDFGLKRCPAVRVVAGRIPPMVWPVGRKPTIVVPREIAAVLSEAKMLTVLAHEMAHIARRDHWVRWLELSVGVVYWWHPVLWFAHGQLRAAEEVCCDGLVARNCPATDLKDYARTLFDIVEFASGADVRKPLLASGIGTKTNLKRRIEMLVANKMPRRMSKLTKVLLLLVAMSVLPLSAAAWQEEKKPNPGSLAAEETSENKPARGSRVVIVVPKAPYRIAPGDLLDIRVPANSALPDAPIDGLFLVEPSGKVPLGPRYGRVRVEKLTLEEAQAAIKERLGKLISSPEVAVTIGGWLSHTKQRIVPIPRSPYHIAPGDLLNISLPAGSTLPDGPIDGLFLVEPSGKVALGPQYGRVRLEGLTLEDAQEKVKKTLSRLLAAPEVAVSLGGWKLALQRSAESGSPGARAYFAAVATPDNPDRELADVLREHVTLLESRYKMAQARLETGTAIQTEVVIASYELSSAEGELALAEGLLADAVRQFEKARSQAEQGVKYAETMYKAGRRTAGELSNATETLLKAKIKLIHAKRAAAKAGLDEK